MHGGVAETGEGTKQSITGHGAGVIVAAFVLIPRVANPSVVTAAQSSDDRQSFLNETLGDKVRGHLIFNASPDFVGVDERQSRFSSARPTAKQQPRLVSHGITRTLGIGMLTQVGLEIVLEDRLQSVPDILAAQRRFDAIDARHPGADDSVRKAAVSVLVLRAFPLQQLLHLTAMLIDLGDHGSE